MDAIFALDVTGVGDGRGGSRGRHRAGRPPATSRRSRGAIVAACAEPVGVEILADGWQVGTPVLGLLDALQVPAAGQVPASSCTAA